VIGCRPYGARVIEAHVTQDFRPGLYYDAPDGAGLKQNRALAVAHPPPKPMGVPHPLRFGQKVGEKIVHLSGGFHLQLHARPVVDPPTQRKPRWVGHPRVVCRILSHRKGGPPGRWLILGARSGSIHPANENHVRWSTHVSFVLGKQWGTHVRFSWESRRET
jgi:hypothetical protein